MVCHEFLARFDFISSSTLQRDYETVDLICAAIFQDLLSNLKVITLDVGT